MPATAASCSGLMGLPKRRSQSDCSSSVMLSPVTAAASAVPQSARASAAASSAAAARIYRLARRGRKPSASSRYLSPTYPRASENFSAVISTPRFPQDIAGAFSEAASGAG